MKRILSLLGIAVMALWLGGCGVIDYFYLPAPEDTAQELYEGGQEAMKDQRYDDAAEYFTKLKDRYPFSPYTPQAELGLGDAYYMDGSYAEAADAYSEFESLHPRHEQMPYVLYMLGKSYYKQFKSIDMPQDFVGQAIESFTRLVQSYPGSKYEEEAQSLILECRRYMAEHEIFVADFYWRTERYGAAWERYHYVMDNFQDLPEVVDYATKRADLAWVRHRAMTSEEEREDVQGSWKDWFDWL